MPGKSGSQDPSEMFRAVSRVCLHLAEEWENKNSSTRCEPLSVEDMNYVIEFVGLMTSVILHGAGVETISVMEVYRG